MHELGHPSAFDPNPCMITPGAGRSAGQPERPTRSGLSGEGGFLRQHADAVLGHRQEPARDLGRDHVAGDLGDADLGVLGQGAEERLVPGQDADLAVDGPGEQERRLTAPDVGLG